MLVIMPLEDGHVIAPDVLRGLLCQSVPVDLMVVSRPRITGDTGGSGYLSQAVCRNILKGHALLSGSSEAIGMLDRDYVLTDVDALRKACERLKSDEGIGSVHFNPKSDESLGHRDIGACVIRRAALEKVFFHSRRPGVCNCSAFASDIESAGFRAENLEGGADMVREYRYPCSTFAGAEGCRDGR